MNATTMSPREIEAGIERLKDALDRATSVEEEQEIHREIDQLEHELSEARAQ